MAFVEYSDVEYWFFAGVVTFWWCFFFRFIEFDTKVRTLRVPTTFYTVEERQADQQPFVLDDASGSILVDPTDARLVMATETGPEPDDSRLLLARVLRGIDPAAEQSCRRRSERRLEPGEDVGVIGRIHSQNGRRVVDANAVFVDPYYESVIRRSVVRNGPIGGGLFVVGAVVMAVTAGLV